MPLPHHDIAIIGSGFGGLGTAIELKRSGRHDFVVLEQAAGIGGTWRANHYPGCACDVPTPYYSFSFAPEPGWSRLFAPHTEILRYLEGCADRFGVNRHVRFDASVTALTWDDVEQRWTISLRGAPACTARVVVQATGGLSRPAYPDLPGLQTFGGSTFHSADWDHSVDLRGAAVAVVGTGASAIQFVPRVADVAAQVDVYQRTPPWVIPKPDREIGRRERDLYRRLPALQRAQRGAIWAAEEYMGLGNTRWHALIRPLERLARAHVRRAISDPAVRAQLVPSYRIGCKRVLLSNEWYPTLEREHVGLVTDGIGRVTSRGIETTTGVTRPADVIIFGTGFHATQSIGDLAVEGRDGMDLRASWAEGMEAHRGTTVAGFPNLFLMPGPNTGTGHTSQVFMIEQQIRHVIGALDQMDAHAAQTIEPRPEAQAAFNKRIARKMEQTVWLRGGCTSWYLDGQGRNTTLWPGSSLGFRKALATIDDTEFHFEPRRQVARATEVNLAARV